MAIKYFKNTDFVDFLKAFVGMPYWFGATVSACTESLLQRKKNQYPTHYTSDRMSKYRSDIKQHLIAADCVNLAKGYIWSNGGENVIESIGKETPLFKTVYASNGCPDQSANGMFAYAQQKGLDWGTISTMPDIPGLAVRYDGHVGYYIGNGEVIEERGFAYGCVKTKLKDRKWLHWYKFPCINYGDIKALPIVEYHLGDRLLKKGDEGQDVKELQEKLNLVLNLKLEVDGDFGTKTLNAVRLLQERLKITVDGKYGNQTHNKFMQLYSDLLPNTNPTEQPNVNTIKFIIAENTLIRKGDSMAYEIITSIEKGNSIEPILNKNGKPLISINGWYAVKSPNQIGWINKENIKEG